MGTRGQTAAWGASVEEVITGGIQECHDRQMKMRLNMQSWFNRITEKGGLQLNLLRFGEK